MRLIRRLMQRLSVRHRSQGQVRGIAAQDSKLKIKEQHITGKSHLKNRWDFLVYSKKILSSRKSLFHHNIEKRLSKQNSQKGCSMEAMNYVKPELIVVAFVLYFFGVALRQAQAVKNKYIPLILGGISMVLCAVWVMATSEIETAKEGAMAVFTAVTQGILVAGLSNYVNQIIKQIHKPE